MPERERRSAPAALPSSHSRRGNKAAFPVRPPQRRARGDMPSASASAGCCSRAVRLRACLRVPFPATPVAPHRLRVRACRIGAVRHGILPRAAWAWSCPLKKAGKPGPQARCACPRAAAGRPGLPLARPRVARVGVRTDLGQWTGLLGTKGRAPMWPRAASCPLPILPSFFSGVPAGGHRSRSKIRHWDRKPEAYRRGPPLGKSPFRRDGGSAWRARSPRPRPRCREKGSGPR